MDTIKELVDRLAKHRILDREEFCFLIDHMTKDGATYLYEKARNEALNSYGNRIFVRGLMEFTNYCKNDCYYCGIRRSNPKAARYRLTPDQIMDCCRIGYGLGLRTFVLQGGEDPWFTDEKIAYLVESIKKAIPTVRSHCPWVKRIFTPTSAGLTPGRTGICCAMKQPIHVIMPAFIRLRCPRNTAKNASGT